MPPVSTALLTERLCHKCRFLARHRCRTEADMALGITIGPWSCGARDHCLTDCALKLRDERDER